MERLLSSSSPTLKLHLKPSSFHHRLAPLDSAKLNFPSSNLRRATSVSCKSQNPSPFSLPSSSSSSSSAQKWAGSRPNGSVPNPQLLNQIADGDSKQRKAITTGAFVLLSALILILVQPAFAPAALASFQTATKSGGPAAAAVGARLIQTELLSSAWTGFFAGCLHTLSGPDHLAALALSQLDVPALKVLLLEPFGDVAMTLAKKLQKSQSLCCLREWCECDVSVYETLENPTVGKKKDWFCYFCNRNCAWAAARCIDDGLARTCFAISCSWIRVPRITEKLTWASSLIAIALGFAIIISQFFGYSLY
ncbi:hypothetical protein M0R45_026628 [Rubus argutus]|uniref:Uncharacterized protein n=1 Tax=Rubus argutus TaxID=59490 RepID=A0AAW1WYS4_RUBAR